MRNPVAHQDIDFPPDEVLEMLATIGYVARKVAAGRRKLLSDELSCSAP